MTAPRDDRPAGFGFLALLTGLAACVTYGLQILSGAYRVGLGVVLPDEAPHYINGLLIARYVRDGLGHSPIAFAKTFFLHYPKVSIGHWPPLYYGAEALWMLLVSDTIRGALALSGLMSVALAVLIGATLARRHGRMIGIVGGLAFALLPEIRLNTSALMLDIPIALLDLAAALIYARYLAKPGWRTALGFGAMASAAILTKGNGLALALLPALALPFSGQWRLLRRLDFWLPAGVVLVLCGPWTLATYALVSDGFVYPFGLDYTRAAIVADGWGLLRMAGAGTVLLSLVGAVTAIRSAGPDRAVAAALCALAGAVLLFQISVPADLEMRYVLPAIPPLFLLAVDGLVRVGRRLTGGRSTGHAGIVAAIVAVLILPVGPDLLRIVRKPDAGMRDAATLALGDAGANPTVLIASDASGEGGFVAALADQQTSRDPTRLFAVARGSKLLASASFMMDHYEARFTTADALATELRRLGIHFVVTDNGPGSLRFLHDRLALQAAHDENWALLGRFPHDADAGETSIYALPNTQSLSEAARVAIGCSWKPRPLGTGLTADAAGLMARKPIPTCE